MKLSTSILGLAFAATSIATPAAPQSTILPPSAPQPASIYPIGRPGSFAKVSRRVFEIDGKKQYFSGSNAWWLAHLSKNSDVDIALKEVAKTGYKILRVWGFGDVNTPPPTTNTDPNLVYFQILNSTGSYINYGPDGIQRLDYAVSAAERFGVKLVLPFMNNWGDYGGISNAYTNAFGNNATTWYTTPAAQKAYKNYIKTLVTRYKKSPAIFAWELGNEPRCKTCPTSTITKWATEISEYIKSLDPNHMVTLGDEGWLSPATFTADGSYAYSGVEGVDFLANLKIKTLDYGTFHLYPDSWGYNYTWGSTWIEQHDAIGKASGKPVILEEYGAPFPGNHTGVEKPWQDTVYKGGIAADQIWQFGTYDCTVPADNIKDVNTIFYGDAEYVTLGFKQAARMAAKRV